jgi:broad specificity phosphatase PhoE
MTVPIDLDERLREREFGVLDGLTKAGIIDRFPGEADARGRLGKFYYRPPGGESWCDVALRVRSVVDTISRAYAGEDVLVVAHQVVVMLFVYVLDRMDEHSILELSAAHELANCSITRYELAETDDHAMTRVQFNSLAALESDTAPVTVEPDVQVAPR